MLFYKDKSYLPDRWIEGRYEKKNRLKEVIGKFKTADDFVKHHKKRWFSICPQYQDPTSINDFTSFYLLRGNMH